MNTRLLPCLLFFAFAFSACSRPGSEIYAAIFGKPAENCVKVINSTDQLVPKMDCCIWLEFKTCPTELRRICGLYNYEARHCAIADTAAYATVIGEEPGWWKPYTLGDSVYFLTDLKPDVTSPHYLLFARDSMHVFYCDMAD